jgi:hypothetical protein
MRTERNAGHGRRKSRSRRLGRELRLWLPFLGLLCCYSLSATAIVVTERVTLESRTTANASEASEASEASDHLVTISSSSTSKASAAPGMMRGGAPRLP